MRLDGQDQRLLSALTARLKTVVEGAPSALAEIAGDLKALFRSDMAVSYGVRAEGAGFALEFMQGAGFPVNAIAASFAAFLRDRSDPFGVYDPRRPEPKQRNVALAIADLARVRGGAINSPVASEFFPKVGLDGMDQLRALVCDGGSLLAWVGGFRAKPFGDRERTVLDKLVPALKRRLRLERDLADAALCGAALDAALEAIGGPAILVRGSGAVATANAAGRALLDAAPDPGGLLRDAAAGRLQGWEVTRLELAGAPPHQLLVQRVLAGDPAPRLAGARRRWSLTPRQTEVLALLARGRTNRAIAARLGCSEAAIELHVSALLRRAGCDGRAALVAAFWTA